MSSKRHSWDGNTCKRCGMERRRINPANPTIFGHPRTQYHTPGGIWSDVYHECRDVSQSELFMDRIGAGMLAYHEGAKSAREQFGRKAQDKPTPSQAATATMRKQVARAVARVISTQPIEPELPEEGELVRLTFDPLSKWFGKTVDYSIVVTAPGPLPRGLDVTVCDTFGSVMDSHIIPYLRILRGREGCIVRVLPVGKRWSFNRGKWTEEMEESCEAK